MGLFDAGAFDQPQGWLSALLQNPNLMNAGGIAPSSGFGPTQQNRAGLDERLYGAPAAQPGPMQPPMSIGPAPQMPSMNAMAQAPQQQMPTQSEPGFLDRLTAGAANFTTGGNPLAGLLNSINGLATGQRTDPQGQALARQRATYEALLPKLGPAGAMAAMTNPKVLESWASREFAPYTAHNVGDIASSFDPKTGQLRPQVQAPRYEKVGAGEKLYAVGGGAPGATAPREIATGGPEKPPQGYDWIDKNDPTKGLAAIPGGPEAKIPANEAGYLAMMNASKEGVANARKFFLDPSFKGGAISAAGSAVGQALNAGDIGRAQRDIKMATETALRIMTGAAAPETEVKRYADMFTPSVYDSRATRAQKLNNLENFLNQAQTNMTAGRVAPQSNIGWVNVGNGVRIREKN